MNVFRLLNLCAIIMSCELHASSAAYCVEESDGTKNIFPMRQEFYTYDEVCDKFKPVTHRDNVSFFETYLKIMFDPKFPLPVHHNNVIIQGYRCYYARMVEAAKVEDEVVQVQTQMQILKELFSIHKQPIVNLNSKLGLLLPELGE